MKRKLRIPDVLLISLYMSAVVLMYGCKKDPVLPTISTVVPAEITSTSAVAGGNVISDGHAAITERGVCWSESANPTVNDYKAANGTGTGIFSVDITGLTRATTYHVRAFAVNSAGTSYGEDFEFTTLAVPPVITTRALGQLTWTTATSGGTGLSDGGSAITAKGVCWSTSSGPVVSSLNTTIDGVGPGDFVSSLTGLIPNTTYYVRSYATNSQGTTYGDELSFKTPPVTEPSLLTDAVTGITLNEAVSVETISAKMGLTL
jgi:hypothetical protein